MTYCDFELGNDKFSNIKYVFSNSVAGVHLNDIYVGKKMTNATSVTNVQMKSTISEVVSDSCCNSKRSLSKRLIFLPAIKFIVATILIGSIIAAPNPAVAAKLTDIIVTNTRDDLLIYMNVEEAFPSKMKEAILSGVPTTFSFFVSLYRNRFFWFDQKVADLTITHSIEFNRLKNEFEVRRSWQNGNPTIVKSFPRAQTLMSSVDNLKVISLERLSKGQQYQIRAKAELNKLKLPLYLHYVLFFVSLWDFETDWYTIDFIY